MKVLDLYGREKNINLKKYLIDWEDKSCSKLQTSVKNFLFPYWRGHVVTEEFRIPSSKLRCDIINWSKKMLIEINGEQHRTYNTHFFKSRNDFLKAWRSDNLKEEWANKMGFIHIEIYPEDVKDLNRTWFTTKYEVDLI